MLPQFCIFLFLLLWSHIRKLKDTRGRLTCSSVPARGDVILSRGFRPEKMPSSLVQTTVSPNHTGVDSSVFFLLGVPGLEQFHLWLSLPVCCLGTATVVGNITILVIVINEPVLHKPVYLFLCMLSTIDLAASLSTVPKLLAILWCGAGHISTSACLTQMFFIHAFCMMESTVLLAMAFDRYVAICHPLRYATLLTDTIIARIGVAAMVRGSLLMLPCPFLIGRLSFCQGHVIPHTYCEHMAVVKLACGDTKPNRVYGLTAALLVIGVDLFCIGLSYALIAHAVFRLSSHEARTKALGTCGSHVCVILISYTPALFSFFTHRFGHHVPLHIHILLANVYLLFPPALNPVVYGVKTKEIRVRVVRVFQRSQGSGVKASQ